MAAFARAIPRVIAAPRDAFRNSVVGLQQLLVVVASVSAGHHVPTARGCDAHAGEGWCSEHMSCEANKTTTTEGIRLAPSRVLMVLFRVAAACA